MPTINDPTFSRGKIGFWTKSDSITYFTGTRVVYTPREPFVQILVNDAMKQHTRLLRVENLDGAARLHGNRASVGQ